jgi:hypothetical protein
MNRSEFKLLNTEQQITWILNFTKSFIEKQKKGPTFKDFLHHGITRHDIPILFGSLSDLYVRCNFSAIQRKRMMSDDDLKNYLKNISAVDPTISCWTTTKLKSHQQNTNRVLIKYNSKTILLHRLAYLLFVGPLIKGLCIMHNCDNEGCFNPEHLEQGTYAKNNQDRELRGRGRWAPGKHHSISKSKRHRLTNPYDKRKLLIWVKSKVIISTKNEWLYPYKDGCGYAKITFKRKQYQLHRLILANELNIKYEDVNVACHKFPLNSPYSLEVPARNDVNPEHLYNGTHSENIKDTLSYHKGVKISPKIWNQIRQSAEKANLSRAGASQEFDLRMASQYNISLHSVQMIRNSLSNGKVYQGTHKKPIAQFDMSGNFIKQYASARDAVKEGFSWKNISQVLTGEKKTHKGFIWKYT